MIARGMDGKFISSIYALICQIVEGIDVFMCTTWKSQYKLRLKLASQFIVRIHME